MTALECKCGATPQTMDAAVDWDDHQLGPRFQLPDPIYLKNDGALGVVSCVPYQLFITETNGCVLGRQICDSVLVRLNIDCHRHAKKKIIIIL